MNKHIKKLLIACHPDRHGGDHSLMERVYAARFKRGSWAKKDRRVCAHPGCENVIPGVSQHCNIHVRLYVRRRKQMALTAALLGAALLAGCVSVDPVTPQQEVASPVAAKSIAPLSIMPMQPMAAAAPAPPPANQLAVVKAWWGAPVGEAPVIATRIYYGPDPMLLNRSVTVTNADSVTFTVPAGQNYFAATSIAADGTESTQTEVVAYVADPGLNLLSFSPHILKIDWNGLPGTLMATEDMKMWTDVGPITSGQTIYVTNNGPMKFYRVRIQ